MVAVDGKTLRGSAVAGQPGRHLLLAALDHSRGVVLGQVDVQAKTNEIPMFAMLLDRIDLAGAVITADALHAQTAHAQYLAGQRRADYLITVKRNQPSLHAQLAGLPWRQIPAADIRHDRGHGRAERRSLKVTAVAAGIAFPHAAQAIQVVRRRRPLSGKNSKKWSSETVYAVTSLTAARASPAQLAGILRGHWLIEDSLHWVPDMTFGEDSSQVRTRNGPLVMASLRNLAITILRLTGHASIAAALRHHARRPGRPPANDHAQLMTTLPTPRRRRWLMTADADRSVISVMLAVPDAAAAARWYAQALGATELWNLSLITIADFRRPQVWDLRVCCLAA